MTTGTKVILTFILFGGIGTIVFLKVKQAKDEQKPGSGSSGSSGSPTGATGSQAPSTQPGAASGSTSSNTPPASVPDPRIGKIANAKYDNTSVYNKDGSLYKVAKKGEWVGTISSVSGGKIFVEGNIRYVFDTTVPSITTNFTGKSK